MTLQSNALGCTHNAAIGHFTGEGRKRRENRESNVMVARRHPKHNGNRAESEVLLEVF